MHRLYSPENEPSKNLEIMAANPYIGRFVVAGQAGEVSVQACAIMGRSADSGNRIYVVQDGIVSTEVFDMSIPAKYPELTIYDAMRSRDLLHVVSNGDQTSTVLQYVRAGKTIKEALTSRTYEPDVPNYTPRITGFTDLGADPDEEPSIGLSILRRDPVTGRAIRGFFTEFYPGHNLGSGIGLAMHTYRGDGSPLPSYDEGPFRMPIEDTAVGLARLVWENLNPEHRVAVAAKVFTPTSQEIHIINGHHGG